MQMGCMLDIACPFRYTTIHFPSCFNCCAVLKTAVDVMRQPCSGFTEVCLCKAVMLEEPLVHMFFRGLSG